MARDRQKEEEEKLHIERQHGNDSASVNDNDNVYFSKLWVVKKTVRRDLKRMRESHHSMHKVHSKSLVSLDSKGGGQRIQCEDNRGC